MSRGIQRRGIRQKNVGPTKPKAGFDFSGMKLSGCALRGHGECVGEIKHWSLLDTKMVLKRGSVLPSDFVVGACEVHVEMLQADQLQAERLGMRVPFWLWQRSPDARQQETIRREVRALRSTARQVPPGVIEERQFPFWQENERREWLRTQRKPDLILVADEPGVVGGG